MPVPSYPGIGPVQKAIARNVAFNWLGTATEVTTGFFIAPFLINRLGDTTYGLWIVIGSLTSYFGLLDLGIRGSAGRYVAVHHARGDRDELDAVVSSAAGILIGFALIALLATVALSVSLPRLVAIPPDLMRSAQTALTIVGVSLSALLVANVFDATLWGIQRFDILNTIDIPAVLFRASATYWAISHGDGLVALAWITLVTTGGSACAKLIMTFRHLPQLRMRPGAFSRASARQLFAYGFWNVIRNVTQTVRKTVAPIAVGSALGLAAVTPFSIATRLLASAVSVIASATGVLAPLSATLHARQNADRQRQLLVDGGKYSLALSLFFVSLLIVLGRAVITLWVGPRQAGAVLPLAVLAIGELLPMSQQVTEGVLMGSARHQPLAYMSLVETGAGVLGALLLMPRLGLIGGCLAFAASATVCRGLVTIKYGCRVVGVSTMHYCRTALLPPMIAVGLPAALAGGIVIGHPPLTWLRLVAYTMILGAGFCTGCLFLMGKHLRACGMAMTRYAWGTM